MSLFTTPIPLTDPENAQRNLLPVKQFGNSQPRSAMKKKHALADVGNTLHQKALGCSTSKAKASVQPVFKEKQSISTPSFKEPTKYNKPMKSTKKDKTTLSGLKASDETTKDFKLENVEPSCNCNDEFEDGMDFMFKNITLTKKHIEDLALVWENPPVVTEKDKRTLTLSPAIEFNSSSFNFWDSQEMDDVDELVAGLPQLPVYETNILIFDNGYKDSSVGI